MSILGIKIKPSIMLSIAQIILMAILIPVLVVILKATIPDVALDFIANTLDEIPIINVFSRYYTSASGVETLTSFSVLSFILEAVHDTIISTYIIGILVYIFVKLGNMIDMKGIPAIQTLLGVFCSSICLKLLNGDVTKSIICVIALLSVAFVLTLFVQGATVIEFFMELGIGLVLATFTAASVSTYCTVLILILKGWFEDFWTAANVFIWALIPTLIFLLIDYFVFGRDWKFKKWL